MTAVYVLAFLLTLLKSIIYMHNKKTVIMLLNYDFIYIAMYTQGYICEVSSVKFAMRLWAS